jgi:hypothetical protein
MEALELTCSASGTYKGVKDGSKKLPVYNLLVLDFITNWRRRG